MRRISTWILSTISVLVLLFGYHTSTSGVATTATTSVISSSPAPSAGPDTAPASGSTGTTTVTGSAASTRYGPVRVAITTHGGTITEVSVLEYPNSDSRDVEINNYALPILVQETIDAQSANVDMVSGATFTSIGYQQSLQSALDQAGL
jgi:uncharacterized protein with FMN-binding domain